MSDRRRSTGQQGEAIGQAYLKRKGYGIIATNWRCSEGEIDIVARDGSVLVFAEVRTRRSRVHGLAEESVTPAKQQRLVMLAQTYLQQLHEQQTPWAGPWRIDVLALQLDATGNARVQHLQNVVEDVW
jgi:putative endonuclease